MSGINADAPRRGIISNFYLGIRVIFSELSWLGLKGLRAWELQQLKKRLAQEHTALGIAVAADLKGREPEYDLGRKVELPALGDDSVLAMKQVRFLETEIAHLRSERQTMRQQFEARLRRKFGLA